MSTNSKDRQLRSGKAGRKAMRAILRGTIAHSMLLRHLDEQVGLARYNEAAHMMNAWWQEVMGRKPEDYRPTFEREMVEASRLVNAVGGNMKHENGIWVIDQVQNPVAHRQQKESLIVSPHN